MTWPRLFTGWQRLRHSLTAVRVRLACGCEATHYPNGELWGAVWCPPHRAERAAAERELLARHERNRPRVTTEEAREWLAEMNEATRNMLAGEKDAERRARRGER